jgi:hypothetical protein
MWECNIRTDRNTYIGGKTTLLLQCSLSYWWKLLRYDVQVPVATATELLLLPEKPHNLKWGTYLKYDNFTSLKWHYWWSHITSSCIQHVGITDCRKRYGIGVASSDITSITDFIKIHLAVVFIFCTSSKECSPSVLGYCIMKSSHISYVCPM